MSRKKCITSHVEGAASSATPEPITMTAADVSGLLGVKPRTLAQWRCLGKGPAYLHLSTSPRSRVLYLAADVDAWLASLPRHGGENHAE
jgi:hypothetical protein